MGGSHKDDKTPTDFQMSVGVCYYINNLVYIIVFPFSDFIDVRGT